MSYSRAISTMGCPELDLAAAAALARRHGVSAIELRALAGNLDLPAYLASVYGTPEQLAKLRPAGAVRVIAFCTSLKAVGGTAAEREAFLKFIPWAAALGVSWLRVFDSGKTGNAAELAEAADTVRWWRELRDRHGWKTTS